MLVISSMTKSVVMGPWYINHYCWQTNKITADLEETEIIEWKVSLQQQNRQKYYKVSIWTLFCLLSNFWCQSIVVKTLLKPSVSFIRAFISPVCQHVSRFYQKDKSNISQAQWLTTHFSVIDKIKITPFCY